MIKNTNISLEPDSEVRKEAKNIIKYTLLLDYQPMTIGPDAQDYVKNVMENTQQCCKGLYTSYATRLNFFGMVKQGYSPEGKLLYLSEFDFNNSINPASINGMILNNCVMSCYHALLTGYLSDRAVTSYNLNNDIAPDQGYAYLLKKEALDFNRDKKAIIKARLETPGQSTDLIENKQISRFYENQGITSPTDFITNMRRRKDIIENNFPFLFSGEKENKDTYHCKAQFMSVCRAINHASKANLQLWCGNQTRSTSSSYSHALMSLIEQVTPWMYCSKKKREKNKIYDSQKKEEFKLFEGLDDVHIVELLYHYYITEKMFNVNVLYSLVRNIINKETERIYLLRGTDIFNILSTISNLPNVFSRTYFMRYAFDHMDTEITSYLDFWNDHDFAKRATGFRKTIDPIGFHSNQWLLQYELFVKYMAYIIPIYDWCFLNMFLEGIEYNTPEFTYHERLKLGISILEKYMVENSEDLIRPILLDDMDGVDIFSEKSTKDLSYRISPSEYEILFDNIVRKRDIELNLQPLTVDKFRGDNLKALHDFYIEKLVFTRRKGV